MYLKNETKHSEMIDIMHCLHQYAPIACSEDKDTLQKSVVHKLLFRGDQLTAEP